MQKYQLQCIYNYQQQLAIGGVTWKSPDGRLLYVLERDDEWVDEALLALREDPQGLPVVKLPYLILMKLQASRTQDLADVSRMLGGADEHELGRVREVMKRYQADSLDDLESLIQLGKLERQRKR